LTSRSKEEERESSDDDDGAQDAVDEIPLNVIQEKHKKARLAVSAEVVGQFHKERKIKLKIVPKKPEQRERIMKRIEHVFIF
jgi:hypothetical protein